MGEEKKMRFIVDIPSDIVDSIDQLIREGRYRSVQDFLYAAVQNQLYGLEGTQLALTEGKGFETKPPSTVRQAALDAKGQTWQHLIASGFEKVTTVEPPKPDQVNNVLFGQFNRFFPVKITTRVLANLVNGGGSSVPLVTLQENASSVARELGKSLVKKERDLGRTRSDMIATALPTKRDESKAKARFESQFVGFLSNRRIEGAPATLRFVNIFKDGNGRVMAGLTSAGLKFASLANPVIDGGDLKSPLSGEEQRFLVGHIATELPQEMNLMRYILEAINSKADNPGLLQERLKQLKPELNPSELTTMRCGLLSRMAELNLIRRIKNGLSANYRTTYDSEQLLSRGLP